MRVKDIVSKDPNVLGGKLVFAGTRVPVLRLVSYLQKDYTLTRFLKGFPTVTRRQAQAFLELGMDRVEELIDQQQAAKQQAAQESASSQPEQPERPMRVLLDEHIDTTFRHHFSEDVTAETVGYRGWKGLDNGDLLRVAEQKFDALVTMDGSIPHQNNLADFDLAVLVLRTTGDDLDALLDVLPALEEALPEAEPGTYREVFPPEEGERP